MKIRILISFIALFSILSCQKEAIPTGQISESLWLEHKGAQMPILVEGNINSKTLILILHGGPGETSKSYNEMFKSMSQPLEERYAIAYYDQRMSGNSRGHFDESLYTADQMVEDVELVVGMLRQHYGSDLKIFLFGHSWGGYLGNAYLAKGRNQEEIKGWIDVAGSHNLEKLVYDGIVLMEEVAKSQIAKNSKKSADWQDVLTYIDEFDKATDGRTAKMSLEIGLEMHVKSSEVLNIAIADELVADRVGQKGEFKAAYFLDNNAATGFGNSLQIDKSDIWDEMLKNPLTDKLKKITIPSLMLWGKYDFVVAPSLATEMMEELGTPEQDKSMMIFENSGHAPMVNETDRFLEVIIDFIEKYNL